MGSKQTSPTAKEIRQLTNDLMANCSEDSAAYQCTAIDPEEVAIVLYITRCQMYSDFGLWKVPETAGFALFDAQREAKARGKRRKFRSLRSLKRS